MFTYVDISDFHNRVRAVLGLKSDNVVTNEQMDVYEKAPFAERLIKNKVKNWQDLYLHEKEKFKIFESCIIYQTALLFEPILNKNQVKKEQLPSMSLEYQTNSLGSGLSLSDILGSLLDELLSEEDAPIGPIIGFEITNKEMFHNGCCRNSFF